MKLITMKFGDHVWRHNPRELRFEGERMINELIPADGGSVVQQACVKAAAVSGEGELFGADCLEQFSRLLALFEAGNTAVLSVPGLPAMFAVLEELKLVARPKDDVLTYRFKFREVPGSKAADTRRSCVALPGECLWDISYRFGAAVERLLELNPWVKRPDEELHEREVRLC